MSSFNLDAGARDDDLTFEREGVALVVDAVSYEFVRGASVDFVDSLIKSTFEVLPRAMVSNPVLSKCCRAHIRSLLPSVLTNIRVCLQVVQNPNSASSCGCGSSFTPKF